MHVGWHEAIITPNWVIDEDLDIINMEHTYGTEKPKKDKKAT